MKRVVVTGIGIVSCIGNDQKTVIKNLKELNSGISKAPEYEEYSFRSLVHGKPNIKLEDEFDRRMAEEQQSLIAKISPKAGALLGKDLTLDLKLGYFDFEKNKPQKVKFTLEIDYRDKKPTNDKDLKSIVNYDKIVKLIKKLVKNKHYNFLETLAEDVFDELFKDKRIDKINLQIEKLEIMKDCSSVGIKISKKRNYEKL